MREEIERFVLLCLLFTPFCRCTQSFKQSWTTLNLTCYVSLDQGSTVYPPPPPPKKNNKKTTTTTNRQPTKNIPVLYIELEKDL